EAYLAIPDGRNEYYGQRATQRLRALAVNAMTRNLIQDQAVSARAATGKAIERGVWDDARRLGEVALRLTADSAPKDELLQLLRRAYDYLPAYKLPAFKPLALGRQEIVSNPPEETREDPTHARIADELFFLGLFDEGAPEFAAAQSKSTTTTAEKQIGHLAPTKGLAQTTSPSNIDYTLALYFLRAGLANRAVSFAEQVWKPIPGDYALDLAPREMVEFLYPVSYR